MGRRGGAEGEGEEVFRRRRGTLSEFPDGLFWLTCLAGDEMGHGSGDVSTAVMRYGGNAQVMLATRTL